MNLLPQSSGLLSSRLPIKVSPSSPNSARKPSTSSPKSSTTRSSKPRIKTADSTPKPPLARASAPRPRATASAPTTASRRSTSTTSSAPGSGLRAEGEAREGQTRFRGAQVWNANRKLGQATGYAAIEAAIKLADRYGVGMVSVDNAFHYLWGGGYVMDAAKRGYIAYTNCTAALAEVVPFGGKFPTLGTNPHSWGFPTTEAIGYPIVIDWATSVVAMGRVQQLAREGKQLPPNAAVDENGR
jgi:hypothetical protein